DLQTSYFSRLFFPLAKRHCLAAALRNFHGAPIIMQPQCPARAAVVIGCTPTGRGRLAYANHCRALLLESNPLRAMNLGYPPRAACNGSRVQFIGELQSRGTRLRRIYGREFEFVPLKSAHQARTRREARKSV